MTTPAVSWPKLVPQQLSLKAATLAHNCWLPSDSLDRDLINFSPLEGVPWAQGPGQAVQGASAAVPHPVSPLGQARAIIHMCNETKDTHFSLPPPKAAGQRPMSTKAGKLNAHEGQGALDQEFVCWGHQATPPQLQGSSVPVLLRGSWQAQRCLLHLSAWREGSLGASRAHLAMAVQRKGYGTKA